MLMMFSTLFFASCGSVKIVGTNKLPENAKNAVKVANDVVKVFNLKHMNLDVPLEEHAFLINSERFRQNGSPVEITVFPAGNHNMEIGADQNNLSFSVEAGKYYEIMSSLLNLGFTMDSADIIKIPYSFHFVDSLMLSDPTNEKILEQVNQNMEIIRPYFKYMKDHPFAIDGSYKMGKITLFIKENRIYFRSVNKRIDGMKFLFNGETIVLVDDGKLKNDNPSSIWYYYFNNGNMEIILTANQIFSGINNVFVFKPVPDNLEQK